MCSSSFTTLLLSIEVGARLTARRNQPVTADYLDWSSFGLAMAEHLRYRNTPGARAERRIDAEKRRQRRAGRQAARTLKLAA
jgi:hypothetical protein